MKMFERMGVGAALKYMTNDELAEAKKVYGRYVDFLKGLYGDEYGIDSGHTAMSPAKFLLQDVDYEHLDSFMWDKGVLVKTQSGLLGVTVGWYAARASHPTYAVRVRTANGVINSLSEDLKKADIPPEALDYVKSTLQNQVHNKVDEAFKEN